MFEAGHAMGLWAAGLDKSEWAGRRIAGDKKALNRYFSEHIHGQLRA